MQIIHTDNPSSIDVNFLTHKINQEKPEYGSAYPFAFFMRDENEHIVAGCNGSVVYGSIYTDQLWVSPTHRRKKLAVTLMEKVHDYGIENGCTMAVVATMSFQGVVSFYERLGYTIDFKREGYAHQSACYFLIKSL